MGRSCTITTTFTLTTSTLPAGKLEKIQKNQVEISKFAVITRFHFQISHSLEIGSRLLCNDVKSARNSQIQRDRSKNEYIRHSDLTGRSVYRQ